MTSQGSGTATLTAFLFGLCALSSCGDTRVASPAPRVEIGAAPVGAMPGVPFPVGALRARVPISTVQTLSRRPDGRYVRACAPPAEEVRAMMEDVRRARGRAR